jgi:hypothetical protein
MPPKTIGGWGKSDFGWLFPQGRAQNRHYLSADEDVRATADREVTLPTALLFDGVTLD